MVAPGDCVFTASVTGDDCAHTAPAEKQTKQIKLGISFISNLENAVFVALAWFCLPPSARRTFGRIFLNYKWQSEIRFDNQKSQAA
ncbi:MAG: hypothetical protein ACLQU6_09145 [Limisphaerales bacterium]